MKNEWSSVVNVIITSKSRLLPEISHTIVSHNPWKTLDSVWGFLDVKVSSVASISITQSLQDIKLRKF